MSIAAQRSQACAWHKRVLFSVLAGVATVHAAETNVDPLRVPSEAVITEARALVARMAEAPKGPYSRIRWYCKDGTVLPPEPYACVPHGGGRQHAEFSAERRRLAELGYSVGTIFAALSWEEFWDADRRQRRLRELALENYLLDVLDGWVLKRARSYRGRVQIEDEEAAGRALLLRLLANRAWVTEHFLLARETVRAVPHSGGEDLTRTIRRAAQDIAESEAEFETLRVETHSSPSARTAGRVRAWANAKKRPAELTAQANQLADDLDKLYGPGGRARRVDGLLKALSRDPATRDLASLLGKVSAQDAPARVGSYAGALARLRDIIAGPVEPALRLQIFDLMDELEAELRVTAETVLSGPALRRGQLLALCRHLVTATYGSGMLSASETRYTVTQIDLTLAGKTAGIAVYLETSRALNRAVGWPVPTVRYVFADALVHYTALEDKAATFVDDLLRGSPALLLAQATRLLAYDAQLAAGVQRSLSGAPAPSLMALNPGLARGRIRVFTDAELTAGVNPDRSEIVVLPQTVAELTPVAGIVTGGEGNLLSHLQLLARNLGIPNVAVNAVSFRDVAALDGEEVVLAVDNAGSVILEPVGRLARENLELVTLSRQVIEPGSLEVPEPDLTFSRPIPLRKLSRKLSGRVVGPKAANLGELNRLFPGRVAPAIALPFGMFHAHMQEGEAPLRARLIAAYLAGRNGTYTEEALLNELGQIRRAISALELFPRARAEIVAAMTKAFGSAKDYGVFIRSDTNVEDLPGFSGAGLSETLPHVVGESRLLGSIPGVWASVLSPRSIAWRANLMKNPERIYSSVLIMKSVAADKSGVMVTTDLVAHGPGLTVSTAWGVGGAVAGEVAEALVLMPEGEERLLGEAKSPYRRELSPAGGIRWQAAPAGAVLTTSEKQQLRELAREVAEKYAPVTDDDGREMPWDIEFGFVDGQLTLFQIRPLVEKGARRAERVTRALAGTPQKKGVAAVVLDAIIAVPEGM